MAGTNGYRPAPVQLMRVLLAILTMVITILSCRSKKDVLYGKCQKNYYACTQVLLKKNGEFEYFQFYDVGGSTVVKGQWQSRDDTVILNSYEQQEHRIDTVIESTTWNRNSRIEFAGDFHGYVGVGAAKIHLPPRTKCRRIPGASQRTDFLFHR